MVVRTNTVRKGVRLSVGVAAIAAFLTTGAFGASGGGTIMTCAGSGARGYSGDDGPAISAKVSFPTGVEVDGKGNVYIADRLYQRVRKVSPGGTITTFAGTGERGFSGDGGPATSAQLHNPEAVAVDRRGNVYIADTTNQRVRMVNPKGIITTLAGSGRYGFAGDGGPAISASMSEPIAVAVDGKGNVYIGDWRNSRVRKVSGGKITTFAGTGRRGFSGDGGPATSAQLTDPHGVTVDRKGTVYIADGRRVRTVSPGGTITTLAGGGDLTFPEDVAVDGKGKVYVADFGDNRVKVIRDGKITTVAGTGRPGYSGDGGPAASAQLDHPTGVALDGKGGVYISDSGNSRVRRVGIAAPAGAASAPKLTLDAATHGLLFKSIIVTASCVEPCSLSATGSVTILGTPHVFDLTPATASLAAACSRTLALRFAETEQTRFRTLLESGQQAQAVVTVKATDKGGRTTASKLTVAIW